MSSDRLDAIDDLGGAPGEGPSEDTAAPAIDAQDRAPRDAATRDSANADTATRDADTATRDAATRDSANADTATRDAATRDSAREDSVPRDAATRDSAHEDLATRDSAHEDLATRDSAHEDLATSDSAPRDAAARDSARAAHDTARDAGVRHEAESARNDRPTIGQSAPAGAVPAAAAAQPPAHDDPLHQASGGVGVGRVVEVTVDSVGDNEVTVRLADGRIGVVPRSEFAGPIAGGDRIRGALLAREDPLGRVWLSYSWAQKIDGWERVTNAQADRTPLDGTVVKAVKGGYVVDLGVRAFMPTSQAPENPGSDFIGSTVRVIVIEANRERDRIIVSVRELQRRESRSAEHELFRTLEVGKRLDGVIRSIAEYGAIVDLGAANGLIPRRELSWGRINDVGDVVSVGDRVRVQVLDVNRSKRRISLSLRRTTADPLSTISEGDVITGIVTKVVEYGAFMRIGDTALEGLVHVSELSEAPCYDARELVIPGEELRARVTDIEIRKRRIGLSVRAAV